MAEVRLESIGKVYPGGVRAVEDVDLEIPDGAFVVLVGPSGCGKSTTLRMIAGLEEITEGRLSIGGRVVNDVPARDRDIAMVFQSYALYPHLTVRRNLAFGVERRRRHGSRLRAAVDGAYRRARREESAEIDARIRGAAETLGITPLLDRLPKALSGGQRQRVALGRALVRDPKVFLLDEPLSNLDAKLRLEMRAELRALHRRLGATMIHVTHDQEEAMTLGDRLVVMKDGRVRQQGAPMELHARPADRFVASFIGSPAMSFLEGRVADGAFRIGEIAIPLPAAAVEGPATLGIRASAIRPGGGTIPFTVEVVERFGEGADLRGRIAGTAVVARIAGTPPAEGEETRVGLDPAGLHLFEPGPDGRRIGGGEG